MEDANIPQSNIILLGMKLEQGLNVQYCRTYDMIADMLTKGLHAE